MGQAWGVGVGKPMGTLLISGEAQRAPNGRFRIWPGRSVGVDVDKLDLFRRTPEERVARRFMEARREAGEQRAMEWLSGERPVAIGSLELRHHALLARAGPGQASDS